MNHRIIAAGLGIVAAALIGAPAAQAFPLEGHPEAHCQVDSGFWFLKGSRRTICDTPRAADGSWHRFREFWTPAHNVPLTCSTYGGVSYSSTSCSGGYFQPQTSNGVEDYPVNDGNVLPDEPPFIAS